MRSVPTLVVAAIALLALTSCQPDAAPIIPDPVPTTDMLFESEEEALAAAEEAYGAYLDVSNLILSEGGANPQRLLEVAGEDVYAVELEGIRDLQAKGWHSVGASTIEDVTLQFYDATATTGDPVVVVYACLNVSDVDVLDSDGNSVVSADRPDRLPFET